MRHGNLHSGRSVCWLLVGPFCHLECMSQLQSTLFMVGVVIVGGGFVLSSMMTCVTIAWLELSFHGHGDVMFCGERIDRRPSGDACSALRPRALIIPWLELLLRDVEHRLLKISWPSFGQRPDVGL